MPQELLRSAVPAGPPSRRWFVLPVSVALHAGVALACFVLPLTAAGDLPIPAPPSGIVHYVMTVAPPPMEQPPRPSGPVDSRPRAAPIAAPSAIVPERPEPASAPQDAPVEGALPAGYGFSDGLPFATSAAPPPPPPAPPPQPPLRRVGGNIREPQRIAYVAPVYPRIAQQAQVEGIVILEAVIGVDGRVDRVRVLRSAPLLDEAAITAVQQWRYTPTLLNSVPVPVLMTITVHFRLN